MFAVFREANLHPITTRAKDAEIRRWKQTSAVKKCHNNLFKKIDNYSPETYMSKIIRKVFKDRRNAPKKQVAYTISVCETILNPDNLTIQIYEDATKHLITKNYVSF